MLITADVRCLNCGRLCGEVEGEDSLPLLFAAIRPWQGPDPCAPLPGRPLRCRHCGGMAFLEDVGRG